MLKTAAVLVVCSVFAAGCAYEVDEDGLDEEPVTEAESAVKIENALTVNALSVNALSVNALSVNALTPETLSAASMSALRNVGVNGDLSRMLVKYLVTCALTPSDSFNFTWTDGQGATQSETYAGALALAPQWSTRGLSEIEQRWVSACIAARLNLYGVSVQLSMRGSHSSLVADSTERSTWNAKEGAFWGNIFAPTPSMSSCAIPAMEAHSRSKLRDCAAGHVSGQDVTGCGSLARQGDCDVICTGTGDAADGYTSCGGASEIVTTFLLP